MKKMFLLHFVTDFTFKLLVVFLLFMPFCGKAQDPIAGFTYLGECDGLAIYESDGVFNWTDADNMAQTVTGNFLISIHSSSLNSCLTSLVTNFQTWIGLNDLDQENNWVWVDGTPLDYTNWGSGEPNNCCGGEDGGTLVSGGGWNDAIVSLTFTFLVGLPFTLPVELIYFKGTLEDNKAVLTWSTAAEDHNDGFEIQRSTNGRDFNKVGWVEGQGNSENTLSYSFEDKDILPNVDIYYRLKRVDFDGRYEYSDVIVLRSIDKDNNDITFSPNPVRNGVTYLHINSAQFEKLNLTLIDAMGKPVYNKDIQVSDGFNQIELDLLDLPNGIYFTKVKSNNHTTYKRLLIAK